jgi:hypothetical protein
MIHALRLCGSISAGAGAAHGDDAVCAASFIAVETPHASTFDCQELLKSAECCFATLHMPLKK